MKARFTAWLTQPLNWFTYYAALLALLLCIGRPAQAQFPRLETFRNATATGWTIGGSAYLTGNGAAGNDAVGEGYLRLTQATTNQAGYAVDNSSFPATQGFSISFEYFAYGGTNPGADGFSVFLLDGSTQNFNIGASGGSLGYAQRTGVPGVSNGYVGIGIDEWGNYSNASEGRNGGINPGNLTPDAVAIRGAGNGSGADQYPYLTGTQSLPFSLDVTTPRAQNGSADYRRAFIDVIASGGTYRITIRIQHGTEVTTTVSNYVVSAPPSTLRVGFSGATGASTNIHEIRNLQIVLPPVAANDQAATLLDTNVSFDVVGNDQAPGSSIDAASVDLNPSLSGIQSTYTVAGEGTFTVNTAGIVTFDPTPTFAGVVRIPYRVNSILNSTSNLANLTVRVATTCATPGKDGPGTLTATSVPNTYFPGTGSAATGSTTVTVGAAETGTTPISAGDLVLLMQMQGATITPANDVSYGANNATGTGNSTTDFTAGQYEYGIAATDLPLTGGTLQLVNGLTRSYQNLAYDDAGTATGQRRFQVIRVPQFSDLDVSGTAAATPAWNGSTGGVLALDVSGLTSFATGAVVDLTAKGFRGGGGRATPGNTGAQNTDYRRGTSGAHGAKGEGTAGTPQYAYNSSAIVNSGIAGYRNGSTGRGAPGNAGGGATDFTPVTNSGNAGGAGGGNGGAGGLGGYGFGSNSSGARALGGAVVALAGTTRITLGGGGGAGSANGTGTGSSNFAPASGGVGGGILLLRTGSVSGTGTLRANGGNAPGTATATEGAGGGGAGGSIVVLANLTSGLSNLTLQANGGTGGSANTGAAANYGPGGGGGGGFIYTNGTATVSVTGGTAGRTSTSSATFGATNGAAGSSSTAAGRGIPYTIAGAGGCLPELNTTLATSTPTLTRSGGPGSRVAPATYSLIISNTGGGAATGVVASVALPAGLFGYDASGTTTVTIRRADGSTFTPSGYTVPATGTNTPTFGNIFLPSDATLLISFRVAVAASAQDEVFYQASATVTYADPTRDQNADLVSPGGTYTSGGPVEGSNYASASNTTEDVRIARPLPVELAAFEAKASGADALLTWITSSEKNNARFEIERSLNGSAFERIGSVQGQGTTSRRTSYRYLDGGVGKLGLQVVYYRLRQVDNDESSSLSPVRVVAFSAGKGVVSLYPNPAPAQATLDLTALPAGIYQGEILDLTGRRVQTLILQGAISQELPLTSLPAGTYLLSLRGQGQNLMLPLVHN
ncbi:T9SS type A sorting domain-containing protein [Hymenobacter psychrotolerans]|uniref:Por secretion system C-terminal sorting domain-containing protein n=1 Tax=Hymenobacter psychrotolerans DSM 18569 TaxID=1121959 RepID=A0A1M7E0Z0_9BACT|nr:T9SS type A sorting domain-containing protein [Hymenobacter psychrotolerans]SHL85425.1 Por secretion system C-terminal sorting domain-containing protein [Hymenobacter psychrotolerans DSM 18569]